MGRERSSKVLFGICLLLVCALILPLNNACRPAVAPTPSPPTVAPTPSTPAVAPTPSTPAVAPTPSTPIVWKYASYLADSLQNNLLAKWMLDEIEKRSGNRIKFERYYAASLVSATEDVKFLKENIVQIAMLGVSYHPTEFKLNLVTALSDLGFSSYEAYLYACKKLYETYEPMRKEWTDNGMVLYTMSAGTPHYVTAARKPKLKWEDFKGDRLRVMGMRAAKYMKWGAGPVNIAFGEVYDAFNRGLLDSGAASSVVSWAVVKWYEVAPYCIWEGEGHDILPIAMSVAAWNKLPKDIQDIFMGVEKEAFKYHITSGTLNSFYDKAFATPQSYFIVWPKQEIERGKQAAMPEMWGGWLADMKKQGLPGQETLDKFLALGAEFDKTQKPIWDDPLTKLLPEGGMYNVNQGVTPWEKLVK